MAKNDPNITKGTPPQNDQKSDIFLRLLLKETHVFAVFARCPLSPFGGVLLERLFYDLFRRLFDYNSHYNHNDSYIHKKSYMSMTFESHPPFN